MEQTTKFFANSKTIIGAILIFLSMIAPMLGVDFSAADATTLTGKITGLLDGGLEVVGLILVVWGRFKAQGPLTMRLGGGDKTNSPWIVGVLALVLTVLSGCVSYQDTKDDPVAAVNASFETAKASIAVYKTLPPCTADSVGLCSKASIIAKLDEATVTAQSYIDTINALAVTGTEPGALNKALEQGRVALKALVTIYAVQALAG